MKTNELKLKIDHKIHIYSYPIVMGIVNCTPDSFYGGSRKQLKENILTLVEKHLNDGATIIDIGGFSTRPGTQFITEKEEIERISAPLAWILERFPNAILSIDTFRSSVADYCLSHGAHIINDISGGEFDPEILDVVAKFNCPYIAMHLIGNLTTMHNEYNYVAIEEDVCSYFELKYSTYKNKGIHNVIIDPGFGFSKSKEDNFRLLKNLKTLQKLSLPILVGLSRKRMIWQTLDLNPNEALNGTSILNTIALQNSASILRVHDVKEAMEAIKLIKMLG